MVRVILKQGVSDSSLFLTSCDAVRMLMLSSCGVWLRGVVRQAHHEGVFDITVPLRTAATATTSIIIVRPRMGCGC